MTSDEIQTRARSDLRSILMTDAGGRVIWRLLDDAGVFRSVYSANPHAMAYQEGLRNAGLRLLARIEEADPHALPRLIQIGHRLRQEEAADKPDEEFVTE
jgi:hypothetical protein